MEIQAIKILQEMLVDRNYLIEYVDKDYSRSEAYVLKGVYINPTSLNIFQTYRVLLCFICDANDIKLNIQGIKDKLSIMNQEKSMHCIIVYRDSVTSSAKKSLNIIDHHIDLFSLKELQLNITKHRLVPVHEKVIDKVLDKSIKISELPVMYALDPVSRYYGYKKGDVIKITRKNGLVIYRQVK
jgi:DNA-directed RNA polymerase I, II, and III subunit RPABC1